MKKSAVKFLLKYGITKDDPDFKEVFGFVYRGASFALVSLWCSLYLFVGSLERVSRVCALDVNSFDLPTEDVHGIRGYQYEPDRQMC